MELVKVRLWGMPRSDSYDSKGFVYVCVFSFMFLLEMTLVFHEHIPPRQTFSTPMPLSWGVLEAARFYHRLVLVLEGEITALEDSGREL